MRTVEPLTRPLPALRARPPLLDKGSLEVRRAMRKLYARRRIVFAAVGIAALVLVVGAIVGGYYLARTIPCNANQIRGPDGSCVQCYHSAHCASKVCDTSTGVCQDCVATPDCRPTDGSTGGQCVQNIGGQNRCSSDGCDDDLDCQNLLDPRIRFCVGGTCAECRGVGLDNKTQDCGSPEGSTPVCVQGQCITCDDRNLCDFGYYCEVGAGTYRQGVCAKGCQTDRNCTNPKPTCYKPDDAPPQPGQGMSDDPLPGICQVCNPIVPANPSESTPADGCSAPAPYCVYSDSSSEYGCAQCRRTSDCTVSQRCDAGTCSPVDTVGVVANMVVIFDNVGTDPPMMGDSPIRIIQTDPSPTAPQYRAVLSTDTQLQSSFLFIPQDASSDSGVFAMKRQFGEQNSTYTWPTVCGTTADSSTLVPGWAPCETSDGLNSPPECDVMFTWTSGDDNPILHGVPLKQVMQSESATFMWILWDITEQKVIQSATEISEAIRAGNTKSVYPVMSIAPNASPLPEPNESKGDMYYIAWVRRRETVDDDSPWRDPQLTLVGFNNLEDKTVAERL